MMTASEPVPQLKLRSKDGEIFEVEKPVAMHIKFVKSLLEDCEETPDMVIPITEVESRILAKVIEFCKFHHLQRTSPQAAEDKKHWNKEFTNVDKNTLFSLIIAANFLDIPPLLDLTCKTVADMIRGKSAQEIRQEFDIENDFTKEEEDEVRNDNAWCEER